MNTTANVANNSIGENLSLENLENEIWKSVKGFEGLYEVSNLGNMKAMSKPKWNGHCFYDLPTKIMKKTVGKNGYEVVSISKKTEYVHRIVSFAFLSNSEFLGLDVNHINGIKTDNSVKNLEWCTRNENIKHAFSTGLHRTDSICKISEETAKAIISKHEETNLGKVLLNRHFFPDVNISTIQAITNGKTWKHLERKKHTQPKITKN